MDDPRSVLPATELARAGARVVVVGGTARRLRDWRDRPRDLDVVVDPRHVAPLVTSLGRLGAAASTRSVLRCGDVHLDTAWGPLDDFVALCPEAMAVRVCHVDLEVEVGTAAAG
jgi:hypothetical protein